MSEFEGRGRGFERGHASAVAKKREAREHTPAEKASDAKAIAGNLAGYYRRVTQNVAAMRTAADAGDWPGWDAAKAAAESGAKDLDRIAKAALAAAPDATEPEVREQLASIEQLQTDVEALLTSAAPAPAPRAPVVSCADALLGVLPPDDPSWQPDHERDATEAKIARIFEHELVYSDIDALTRLLRDHPEHAITRRFERVGKARRVRLFGRFEKPKFKADAREREARHRATAPSREPADADHDDVAAALPPSIEEPRLPDLAPVLRGQDADGAADRHTAVESDAATLGTAPSTAASGAASAALGSRIASAAGATYPGEGIFQIPDLPDVLITVQRTAAATPRRRRTANEIVLEIPRGLADDELARVAIEQLTLLREESPATAEDAAADGVRDAAEPLPHHEQIQRSFGDHRVDHVRAQVGGPAAGAAEQLGATAYATGDRVGFADSPSLHTAAHEAAHVVQQRAGVALKGDGDDGDAYEQHADAVADQVVRGESAEALLDEMAPRASGTGGAASAVQRKEQGAQPTRATAAGGEHKLERKPDQKWHVFAESGKPYIIEPRNGKPGAWVIRDWVKAAPDCQKKAGVYVAPSCARELLTAMGWVEPERIEAAADRLIFRFTRSYDYLPMGANAMNATGLPAGTDAVVERGSGGALKTTIRLDDPSLPPGTEHAMTASEQTRAVRALAEFTGLEVAPDGLRFLQPVISAARQMTGNGALFFEWDRTVCRTLFGFDAYERWQTGKQPEADRDEKTPKLKLSNYYQRPIPGELSHHADIVESGEQIRLEALVNWPVDTPNPAIYEIAPMVTPSKFGTVALLQCNWRFERISAGTKSASPAAPASAASAMQDPRSDAAATSTAPSARATSTAGSARSGAAATATAATAPPAIPVASTASSGATPEQAATETAEVFHRFKLAPGEASATFRVTCDARFDAYFTPTTFTRDVVVMSSDAALSSLRTAAFTGLGGDDAARRGSSWTADASAALTASPPTGSTDATARGRTIQRTQLEAVRAHLGNNPASADAVAAIDRELARQAKTEQLLTQDRARGWQPFQLRGTYLSRTEGLASGPLDLHGTVHVVQHYDVDPGDGGSTVQSTRSDQYVVQIRDLSRRFEQQDFTFEGRGGSFDRALSDAFEDLAVAYPKGMVAIEAEQLASRAGAADGEAVVGARTGKVVGFQRSTETTWKKVKETVWDPVASLAVNLGAIALMTLVPGSAAIVAPAIIAYNSIPAVDRIATEADRGTLTTGKFATAAGELALNLLPVVGRARPFTAGWFAIETANWGGQVALMTASAVDTARGLQAQQVAALAIEYEAFLQLQKRSLPSDPNLAAAEAAIRNRAAKVADEISQQIRTQIHDNAIVMVTGSVIHNTSAHARTAIIEHLSRRVPGGGAPDTVRTPDTVSPPPIGRDGSEGAPPPPKSRTPAESEHGAHPVGHFTGQRPKREKKPVFSDADVAASTRDAAAVLNYGETGDRNAHLVGDNRVLITVGSSQVNVKIVIGEPMPQVATHNYKPGDRSATVTVSKEARPQDITRAVAHELAEIQNALKDPQSLSRPDALKEKSNSDSLSAHDEGRKAELKILLYELKNQPARKAEIQTEIKALVEHLGFDMATINGDMRARRVFGDETIARLDSMNGRERIWFKPEEVIVKSPPPKAGAKERKVTFDVNLPGHGNEPLGQAVWLIDEQGQAISDPQLLLHKDTVIDGKNIRISIGDPSMSLSFTDLAIKLTKQKFKEATGHEPETLPGSLADDNKAIFQRAYAMEMIKNTPEKQALEIAILETPFGSKRKANGYDKIEVAPRGETEILVGHPPQLVKVPANIDVTARKSK